MPSADGPQGPGEHPAGQSRPSPGQSMELQLFESLIHHLIEKGVLTKNDALSVVQTVAEVKRGEREAGSRPADTVTSELTVLQQLYSSFELVRELLPPARAQDGRKVLQLRPPLHGDNPRFPKDD